MEASILKTIFKMILENHLFHIIFMDEIKIPCDPTAVAAACWTGVASTPHSLHIS
jgi:hypothetical protein